MTDTPSQKHVFMSYSRKDEVVMRCVAEFLRKQSIDVWVDNEKLVPGTPIWEVEIEKAIREAKEVVILQCCNQEYQDQLKAELTITVSDTENNLYDSR